MFRLVRSLRFSLHQPVLWCDLPHHLYHWLESEDSLCLSAVGWNVWPSGQSDSRHRWWAQVLHRCQRRAHVDQPPRQQQEFPARLRRDNRHHLRSWCTSTFRSFKQQQANNSKQSSHHVRIFRCEPLETAAWFCRLTVVQATGAYVDGESVVPTIFSSESKGKKQNVVQSLRDGTSPQSPWAESWAGCPRRELGSAKIIRSWGRRGRQTLGKEKFRCGSLWGQSGVWITSISATTSESVGRSGLKR